MLGFLLKFFRKKLNRTRLLDQTLTEKKKTDAPLTEIAESVVNVEAA